MTGIEAEGVDRFAATLTEAASALGDLAEVERKAGELVIGSARIPRRTGRLARSARVYITSGGFAVVLGGPSAPYAPYVRGAHAALTDALDQRAQDVTTLIAQGVDDALGHVKGD